MPSVSALAAAFDNTQDTGDKFRVVAQAFIDTLNAVTTVSGRVFHSMGSLASAGSHVMTLSDLFGVLGIPHDAIQVISSKTSLFKKACLVNLAACRVLFCVDALQTLKAFDLGKLPHIGSTVSRYTLGVVAQPLLITLSALEILEGLWQNIKAYEQKKSLAHERFEFNSKIGTLEVVPDAFYSWHAGLNEENEMLSKLSKEDRNAYKMRMHQYYSDQNHNIGIETRRNWVSIAVNVLKIAAAVLSLIVLLGVTAPGLVPAAAIVVAIASIAALGKLFYDFYLNEQIRVVLEPKMV